jgi:hypothetical protein
LGGGCLGGVGFGASGVDIVPLARLGRLSGPGDNGSGGGGGNTAICNRLRVGHGGFGYGCGMCRAASEEGCTFGC